MLRRIPQKKQLDLFEGAVLYVSQADAARVFGVTTRMIQYWEAQGLLNPELPAEGRSRRYTNFDLVELDLSHPPVADYVVEVMCHWLARGIDGWRLDAAYAPGASGPTTTPTETTRSPSPPTPGPQPLGDHAIRARLYPSG